MGHIRTQVLFSKCMANIEGTSVLMTSVPRTTASDGQRDRFGNKASFLEGGSIRAGPETM